MKAIILVFLLAFSVGLSAQCPGLVVEKMYLEHVGYNLQGKRTLNLHVYAHTTNGTTPSLKVYAKCGEWYFNHWLCVNIPHTFETEDTFCGAGERFEVYVEWYTGPNCTGQRCLTTPVQEVVKEKMPVKKIGNVLSFAPDVKEVEVINSFGVTILRQIVKGDITIDAPNGIYFIRTRGDSYKVLKIML